jgi:small subunit ribosomal protein S1
MADDIQDEKNESEEESFAELFESYSAGIKDDIEFGEKVRGKVISIGKDTIFLDVGSKIDAVADKAEFMDDKGDLSLNLGDEIELFVTGLNEHEIRLSKAISGVGGLEILEDAFANKVPVEGKVGATCKGGFQVEILKRRAFCPVSQMDVVYVETPEDYVGQTCQFLITRLEEKGRNIVVSRRKLLEKVIEEKKKEFFNRVNPGDILDGRVTKLMPYGIFVELIPGVEGMVHISELSWSRVEKPEEVSRVNDRVTVKVLEITSGKRENQKKISLSMKQIENDPWETVAEKVKPGAKITGKVTRCMNFGVFVEIIPGIEGLVHISEMSYVKRVIHPEDVVAQGERIPVLVKELDIPHRRISLSMRDVEGDPWLEVSDRFKVGQIVQGTLEHKEKFGSFISIAPGITGLLPRSKYSMAEKSGAIEQLKAGDSIAVAIESIHAGDRKISLAPTSETAEGSWKQFAKNDQTGSMSDLAAKLKKALESGGD